MRRNVDVDVALTGVANGCSRGLANRLQGWEKARPKELDRRFVETSGTVEVGENRRVVRLERRSHHPILREAWQGQSSPPIPWLGNRLIQFSFV